MPRKASMTVQEAETAIENLLQNFHNGARPIKFEGLSQERKGALREAVRKWFSAKGMRSSANTMLTYFELETVYNDPDGKVAERTWKKYREGQAEDAEDAEPETSTETKVETKAETKVEVNGGNVNDIARLLAELFAKSMDKAAINALIDSRLSGLPELVAKYANVHVVELKKQDGSTHKIEGHCHAMLPTLIRVANSRQPNGFHPNIMISGPTGSGKTHGVEQMAKELGLEFYSNGAISQDYQLVGFRDAGGNYHTTPLRKAFARKAAYLFDEFDGCGSNTPLLSISAVLANNGHEFPDAFVERNPDCVILCAGNTWGNGATADFVGRIKIDGAVRSRFPVRVAWPYDEALERNISGNVDWACRVQKARQAAFKAGMKVIIDPRMTFAGSALIAAGLSEDEAAKLTYLADLTEDQRRIVEA
jgi:hypothetical protein